MTAPRQPGQHDADTTAAQDLPQAPPRPGPPPAGYRPPEFVVEVWVSPQLRARHPDWPLSLHEAVQVGHRPNPERDPEPEVEP